jgi:hypothetical protein
MGLLLLKLEGKPNSNKLTLLVEEGLILHIPLIPELLLGQKC